MKKLGILLIILTIIVNITGCSLFENYDYATFTSFMFPASLNQSLATDVIVEIDNHNTVLKANLPENVDLTNLIATYTLEGSCDAVRVTDLHQPDEDGAIQESGKTSVDYSNDHKSFFIEYTSKDGIYFFTRYDTVIGKPIDQSSFTDSTLLAVIKNQIGKEQLYTYDLLDIYLLKIMSNVSNLSGIQALQNLDNIIIDCANISDSKPLHKLDLYDLKMENCRNFNDLSFIDNFDKLLSLGINSSGISEITFLQNSSNLEYLSLSYNDIQNIDILAGAVKLKQLYLNSNKISDISPLKNLAALKFLDIRNNNLILRTGSPGRNVVDSLLAAGCYVFYEEGNMID